MRSLLRIIATVFVALCMLAGVAAGEDTYRVARSVRLLRVPDGQRLKTLHRGELVTATGGKRGDYVRVQDSAGTEGWVYLPYLTEAEAGDEGEEEEIGTGPPIEPPSTSITPSGEATAINPSWEKPEPRATDFVIGAEACGPAGIGEERTTNVRKNRIDVPSLYHPVTFQAVDELPFPEANTKRSRWTDEQLAAIAPYEGVALTVTGYLVAIKPQKNNEEDCNCDWKGEVATDWHLAITAQPGEQEKDAIVVETTPRVRAKHPNWTTTNLAPWLNSTNPIRVSGWLLMDPAHKAHLHPNARYPALRNTLWEIHPITKFEVMKDGRWVELDSLLPS